MKPAFEKNNLIVIVGSALLWAWLDSFVVTPALVLSGGSSAGFHFLTFVFAMPICCAVLLIGFLRPVATQKIAQTFTGICGLSILSLVSGLASMLAILNSNTMLFAAASIANGVVLGFGTLGWGCIYARGGAKQASICVPGSYALAAAVGLLMNGIGSMLSACIIILLPTVSFFVLIKILGLSSGDNGDNERRTSSYNSVELIRQKRPFGLSWSMIVAFALFGLAQGFMQFQSVYANESTQAVNSNVLLFTRLLIALILFLAAAVLSWKVHIVYRVGLVVMIAGFMAMPFFVLSNGQFTIVSSILVTLGFACFDFMCWIVLSELAFCSRISYEVPVGFGRGLVHFGIVLGDAVGYAVALLSLSSMKLIVVITSIGYLLVIAVVLLIGDNHGLWSSLRYGLAYDEEEFSQENDVSHLLALFSRRYQLSTREEEVLKLLSQGRSGKYIAQELFISENTVKSHVKHIYAKCGSHNRQELLDLLRDSKNLL